MPCCISFSSPTPAKCFEKIKPAIDWIKRLAKKIQAVATKILDFVLPRNEVTGKREIRIIPTKWENVLGEKFYDSHCPISKTLPADSPMAVKVTQVFNDIIEVTPRRNDLKWEVRVKNDDDTVNAFCLPGGKVVITTGLIKKLQETYKFDSNPEYENLTLEDNIAAVLGHEIIHAAAGHSARSIQFSLMLQGLGFISGIVLPRILIKGESASAHTKRELFSALYRVSCYAATPFIQSANSRSHEHEADFHGIEQVAKTEYNIQASARLQEVFLAMKEGKTSIGGVFGKVTDMLSTHPTSKKRLDQNKTKIAEELAKKQTV